MLILPWPLHWFASVTLIRIHLVVKPDLCLCCSEIECPERCTLVGIQFSPGVLLHLHFLRIFRKWNISLVCFSRSTMERILAYYTVANRKELQRVTRMTEKVSSVSALWITLVALTVSGGPAPSWRSHPTWATRCLSHYRAIKSRTNGLHVFNLVVAVTMTIKSVCLSVDLPIEPLLHFFNSKSPSALDCECGTWKNGATFSEWADIAVT